MPTFRSSKVVVDEEVRPATVRIEDGLFVEIGEGPADEDYGDLLVLPGLVDSHVHVNEPGRSDWEGFETATMAAAAGGTTTIVDMPLNSVPPTTSVENLEAKRDAARGKLSVDVAFWGGIVPGSEGEVSALETAGVCGFKAFLVDSGVPEFGHMTIEQLAAIETTLPILVHAEDGNLLQESGPTYDSYLASRPPESEASAIRALSKAGVRAHVLHVSSADGVAELATSPGLSGETCPHYLYFSAADVTGPEFKCAPPIREAAHRESLWEALSAGILGIIVSDHSPSPPELKTGGFDTAWGGISSVELRLPVVWTGAEPRGLDFAQLAEWLAVGPARLAGLSDRKGTIAVGMDADYLVFDPDVEFLVAGRRLHHRHSLTPYEGRRLKGTVVETVLGGEVVYDGENVRVGRGSMLRRT